MRLRELLLADASQPERGRCTPKDLLIPWIRRPRSGG